MGGFPSCSAFVLHFLGLWEVWLPSALAMRPLASEISASLSECLLPLAEGSCGQGFWVSGKWGAVLELGISGPLGTCRCYSQGSSTCLLGACLRTSAPAGGSWVTPICLHAPGNARISHPEKVANFSGNWKNRLGKEG